VLFRSSRTGALGWYEAGLPQRNRGLTPISTPTKLGGEFVAQSPIYD